MSDAPSIYQRARADVAAMLGYDLDALLPEQALRLDVATSLRVLLDSQSGRLVRGESLDARELLAASTALSQLLPSLREPPPANAPDPRAAMWAVYKRMRDRGAIHGEGYDGKVRRIAELEAEVERLKAGTTAPGEGNNIDSHRCSSSATPGGNVVQLSPRVDNSSPPAADVVVDLRASRANGAGGSAGFRIGPADEPWRGY
jgi:hypothetical protein